MWKTQDNKEESKTLNCLPPDKLHCQVSIYLSFVFINGNGGGKYKGREKKKKTSDTHPSMRREKLLPQVSMETEPRSNFFNGCEIAFAFEDVFPKYDGAV